MYNQKEACIKLFVNYKSESEIASREFLDADYMRRVSNDLERLARLLKNHTTAPPATESIDLPKRIRDIIRFRRKRDQMFSADLFADPAWDILLDLTLARLENRKISVSSLSIAAAVPTTTALRWIKSLHDAGIIERLSDPEDRRRSYVQIGDLTFAKMVAFLSKTQG